MAFHFRRWTMTELKLLCFLCLRVVRVSLPINTNTTTYTLRIWSDCRILCVYECECFLELYNQLSVVAAAALTSSFQWDCVVPSYDRSMLGEFYSYQWLTQTFVANAECILPEKGNLKLAFVCWYVYSISPTDRSWPLRKIRSFANIRLYRPFSSQLQ